MAPRRELPLDANALELFARTVAAGSFAQAARELGLTRAAVSRRVAVMEAALGQPLFARTTRALGLTETGRRLAVRARAVAEAAQAARQSYRARGDGLSGSLRVTAVPSFGNTVLAPLLARFQAAHPQLRLELSFTHRRVDLLREDVDVAFRITSRPPPEWVARPMLRFVARAYAKRRRGLPLREPAQLADQRCLVLGNPADSLSLRWRHDDGRQADVQVVPACTSDDLATLVGMAREGNGVVFAPDFTVRDALTDSALADALPGWQLRAPEGDLVQALMLPLPASSPAALALVRFVQEQLGPVLSPTAAS